jgi:hypothetical protein
LEREFVFSNEMLQNVETEIFQQEIIGSLPVAEN